MGLSEQRYFWACARLGSARVKELGRTRRGRTWVTDGQRRSCSARPAARDSQNRGATEAFARQLLARWGVVFRDLVKREALAPAWRDLLVALRRLEARGEIRGGRFAQAFVGEQFALPEAVELLRAVRRQGVTWSPDGQHVWFAKRTVFDTSKPNELWRVPAAGGRRGRRLRRGNEGPARDKPAITSLRFLAVLNVLFKHASARRAARALY